MHNISINSYNREQINMRMQDWSPFILHRGREFSFWNLARRGQFFLKLRVGWILWTQPNNIWIIYLFITWNWHLCFVSKEKSWIVWQGKGKADYWTIQNRSLLFSQYRQCPGTLPKYIVVTFPFLKNQHIFGFFSGILEVSLKIRIFKKWIWRKVPYWPKPTFPTRPIGNTCI